MKVLVVGAAGKTGRLVVEKALAAGHAVVALVHHSEDKHPLPASAEVVHGDVRNPAGLEQAMQGCDAVIDALGGHTPWASTELETDAAKVVVRVMDRVGAKRLVVVSVLGAGDSLGQGSWAYEHLFLPTFLHGTIEDKNRMEGVVANSDLDWILVRPPFLTDSPATGSVRIVEQWEEAHKITREDLAQFLVEQLTSDLYVQQAVTVANH